MKGTSSPTASRLYNNLSWLWPILNDPAHTTVGRRANFRDAICGHATISTRTLIDLNWLLSRIE